MNKNRRGKAKETNNKCVYIEKYIVAPAPSRDYFGIKVLTDKISVHHWRISHGPRKQPGYKEYTFKDYKRDLTAQTETKRIFGHRIASYILKLATVGGARLEMLPGDLIQQIAKYLPNADVFRLSQVSTHLRKSLIGEGSIFRPMLEKYYKKYGNKGDMGTLPRAKTNEKQTPSSSTITAHPKSVQKSTVSKSAAQPQSSVSLDKYIRRKVTSSKVIESEPHPSLLESAMVTKSNYSHVPDMSALEFIAEKKKIMNMRQGRSAASMSNFKQKKSSVPAVAAKPKKIVKKQPGWSNIPINKVNEEEEIPDSGKRFGNKLVSSDQLYTMLLKNHMPEIDKTTKDLSPYRIPRRKYAFNEKSDSPGRNIEHTQMSKQISLLQNDRNAVSKTMGGGYIAGEQWPSSPNFSSKLSLRTMKSQPSLLTAIPRGNPNSKMFSKSKSSLLTIDETQPLSVRGAKRDLTTTKKSNSASHSKTLLTKAPNINPTQSLSRFQSMKNKGGISSSPTTPDLSDRREHYASNSPGATDKYTPTKSTSLLFYEEHENGRKNGSGKLLNSSTILSKSMPRAGMVNGGARLVASAKK